MIVVDSSVLIAFNNARDIHHRNAVPLMERMAAGQWGKAILLEYVFVETISVIKRKVSAEVALRAGTALRRARQFDFIPCSDLFRTVWLEFQFDVLTPLSFTDTAITQVARQRAGGKILTFDKAFRDLPGIVVEPT